MKKIPVKTQDTSYMYILLLFIGKIKNWSAYSDINQKS